MTDTFNYADYSEAAAFKTALLAYEHQCQKIDRFIHAQGWRALWKQIRLFIARKLLGVTEDEIVKNMTYRLVQIDTEIKRSRSQLWLAITKHDIDGEEAKTLVFRYQMQVTRRLR